MAKNIRVTAVWVVMAAALCLGYAGFHAARAAEATRAAKQGEAMPQGYGRGRDS